MLDRLPTELLLVIAELAVPQTANSRYRLSVGRRCWFASLASVCRFFWDRLRPLAWVEIWIFEGIVGALASALGRDPSFATFTRRLICSGILATTLEELGRILPYFSNVTSMEIMGGGTDGAPLQLSVIERLHALKHLSLSECMMTPVLPRLDRLETLVLSDNMVISPGGDLLDVAPTRIITELPSTRERSLRLLRHYGTSLSRILHTQRPNFANLTLLELVANSFKTIRRMDDVFPSLTCRVVLRCKFDELDPALPSDPPVSALSLPRRFEIWVQSDKLPGFPRHSSTRVQEHLQALISVPPHLSALTLPLNLGLGRSADEITQVRAHLYALLKQFARAGITISFHNEPPNSDVTVVHPYFKTLDEFDGEGYFSDLVKGKVDDPELHNFRVVVV